MSWKLIVVIVAVLFCAFFFGLILALIQSVPETPLDEQAECIRKQEEERRKKHEQRKVR